MDSSRDDAPDPTTEPDAGPVGGGGPDEPSSDEQAQNAEVVPDPDAEPGDHELAAADRVDRLERHNRSSSTGT